MVLRVAINGFGRIGRLVFRAGQQQVRDGNVEFVAANDLSDAETLATLLKYDSTHREYDGTVETSNGKIIVDGNPLAVLSTKDPAELPWGDMGIDLAVESTGAFRERKDIAKHIEPAGARYVILTVPSKTDEDVDNTVVIGVNDSTLDLDRQHILSNASCTTNCLAPMVYVLQQEYGIEKGLMTTIHAYTNDQRILDFTHKDPRRARTAAANIIPTSTGAAKAIGLIIPELKEKITVGGKQYRRMDGLAMRVPVVDGSITDLIALLSVEAVDPEQINETFKRYAEGQLAHILQYTEAPLVSGDIIGNPKSCVFDAGLTMVAGGNLVKVCGWYDNEWGYSSRVVDLMGKVREHLRK